MEDNVIKINSMLLSPDTEMRRLGKVLAKTLPKETSVWGKILVGMNSGTFEGEKKARQLFCGMKKSITNFHRLLNMFEERGYIDNVGSFLTDVEIIYKRTKKLANILKEDDTLTEFLKRTNAVSIKRVWGRYYDNDED